MLRSTRPQKFLRPRDFPAKTAPKNILSLFVTLVTILDVTWFIERKAERGAEGGESRLAATRKAGGGETTSEAARDSKTHSVRPRGRGRIETRTEGLGTTPPTRISLSEFYVVRIEPRRRRTPALDRLCSRLRPLSLLGASRHHVPAIIPVSTHPETFIIHSHANAPRARGGNLPTQKLGSAIKAPAAVIGEPPRHVSTGTLRRAREARPQPNGHERPRPARNLDHAGALSSIRAGARDEHTPPSARRPVNPSLSINGRIGSGRCSSFEKVNPTQLTTDKETPCLTKSK